MASSSFVEHTQVVAQAEPDVPRFERVAVLAGVATFLIVLATGFVLYLVEFQVDRTLVNAAILAIVVGSALVFFRSRPASKLTPTERMVRSKRVVAGLVGLLAGASVLGSIVTATQLHTTQDWIRLAFTATSPLGFYLIINTRFTIG